MKTCEKCQKEIKPSQSEFKHGLRYDNGDRYYEYYHSAWWDELKEEEKKQREQRRQENQERRENNLREKIDEFIKEIKKIENELEHDKCEVRGEYLDIEDVKDYCFKK